MENNPLVHAIKLHQPFNVFHTHVINRKILDEAVAAKKSLEVDISITPEGIVYVGHPLSYYKGANLPPPDNLSLEVVVKEAKAAGLFLILDLKDPKVILTAKKVVSDYGAENCLVHAFCRELSFLPWPAKIKAIEESNWKGEELPLDELLNLHETTGAPLALSCHGITRERLNSEEDAILRKILNVSKQGAFAISLSMPPDEETPLAFANKLIEHNVVPMIRFDDIAAKNRPAFFLGFTNSLEQATALTSSDRNFC